MPRGKSLEQREKERPEHGYWIIPPEIHEPLNKEFNFEFDPCPNPKPKLFNGLEVDWKKSNWVNPPFWAGITYWVNKAIEEQQKGNTSVLILPLDNWVKKLFDAKAEIRVVGSHEWIHTEDGSRRKAPRPSFLFILKGNDPKLERNEENDDLCANCGEYRGRHGNDNCCPSALE
ncbi:hypothetical protein LCGC14_1723930, partial [marine sediment metagenome]